MTIKVPEFTIEERFDVRYCLNICIEMKRNESNHNLDDCCTILFTLTRF